MPTTAAAFSDPVAYDDDVIYGGGGGRWFTGSVSDGYGCDACHEGGEAADLSLTGGPTDGYTPSTSYEFSLTWPLDVTDVALVGEITDELRQSAGTIEMPRFDALGPDEVCSPEEGGAPAAGVVQANDGRSMIALIDCGATRLRFRWTAPPIDMGTVWLNLGFVRSDASADPSGDGVTMIALPMTTSGTGLTGRSLVDGGCAVGAAPGSDGLGEPTGSGGDGGRGGTAWAWMVLALVGSWRVRARGRRVVFATTAGTGTRTGTCKKGRGGCLDT